VDDFDGVHTEHRALLGAARKSAAGDGRSVLAVVVADPGADGLLTTVERRLELLAEAGPDEALVLPAPPAPELLAVLDATQVRSSRQAEPSPADTARSHLAAGRVAEAAAVLGRPAEVEGTVVVGDARGTTLGYPTANLDVPTRLLVPAFGVYAGVALGHRAAVSIGTNPHYGGRERRIEVFLLDFAGDLYGRRLVVELWQRLRDERAFASEQELVDQIGRDVEAARAAARPGA
jgi:FAD synthase